MTSNKSYNQILINANIRPSVQRVAIYSFLREHPVHPDADTVFSALSPDYSTLSKTTVYNTLKLFEEKGIVQSVLIEDDKVRFDANTTPHLHFKCEVCHQIFDLEYKDNSIQDCAGLLPAGFTLNKAQTYLWGRCSNCRA